MIAVVEETAITRLERAEARDSFVRDFDKRWGEWVNIAKVCLDIEHDGDWKLLGFHSFGSWIVSAAPKSRSYLYLVMGRYKELSLDIPEDELAQIPLGSAGVLKQLSTSVRRDPKVRQAARQTPREFRQAISETHPDQLIEGVVEKKFRFHLSAWKMLEEKYETYCLTAENATWEEFLEFAVSCI